MPFASSDPHDYFSIEILSARIIVWPMNFTRHRRVLSEASVGTRVGVCLGAIVGVVGDGGLRLALMCQSKGLEDRASLSTVRRRLREKQKKWLVIMHSRLE